MSVLNSAFCSRSSSIVFVSSAIFFADLSAGMLEAHKKLKLGSPLDFSSFTSAVIDQTAFKKISKFIEYGRAKQTLLAGGETNSTKGWFIEPTIFQTQDPDDRLVTMNNCSKILFFFETAFLMHFLETTIIGSC